MAGTAPFTPIVSPKAGRGADSLEGANANSSWTLVVVEFKWM